MAEKRIKEAIANLTTVDHIRPNKLRKVVCKNGDVNWTEFQEALDAMVERNELQTEKQNGEEVILVSNNGGGADKKDVGAVENDKKKRKEFTMEIPLAVAQHLTRKGKRKQKNIEQTCKSKLLLSGVDGAKSPRDNVTLQIINEYGAEDGLTEDESKQKASKQIKAAKVLVGNMVTSFRDHPDRFTKMAGGTLDEQAKAKKIREKGAKLRAGKQQQKRGSVAGDGNADAVPNKKKKKRKFY